MSQAFCRSPSKKNPTWNTRKKGHGGPPAEWPPPQVSENLKCYEAASSGELSRIAARTSSATVADYSQDVQVSC